MSQDSWAVLQIVAWAAAIIFGAVGWLRNRDTDKAGGIRQITELDVKVGLVLSGITEIKEAAKKTDERVGALDKKVALVEKTADDALARIEAHIKEAH